MLCLTAVNTKAISEKATKICVWNQKPSFKSHYSLKVYIQKDIVYKVIVFM